MSAAAEIDVADSETGKVFAWRYEQLLRAGLTDKQASAVAASDFDLHVALRMLSAGCPRRLLVRIAV